MYLSEVTEKKLANLFCLFLILINLVTLYFTYDLLSYDELIGYLSINEMKSCNTRPLAFLFLVTSCANLLFVFIHVIRIIVDNTPVTSDKSK